MLVAAPTGSGKTIVGEFAVHLALETGRKAFYTTPIKALSNQKFNDLVKRYGADKVGLLTGDNSINGEAPVVVMTTEVLRNMLYAGSRTLTGLGFVVMDEVHYLADRMRGAVWEEVIIHLPESVALASLSATVSNAEEFGEWLGTVRGETTTIVEERRPVPLYQHVMVGRRVYDLFADEGGTDPADLEERDREPQVNPELLRVARDDWARGRVKDRRPKRGGKRPQQGSGRHARRVDPEPARGGRAARPRRAAARHRVHLQPRRLRRRGAAVPERQPAPDHARGARRDLRVRPGTLLGHPRRGPRGARLPRVPRRADPRHRRPPRRDAADVQGVRRGAVPARAVPRRVRHRDPGARHQHAGPVGGHREAVEVERRDARRHHAGGVHPAHRPGRAPRHRRRGPRGGALAAGSRPQGGGRPRVDPYLPAQVELPSVVQHGGQPGAPVRPRAAPASCWSRRSHSSRPTRPWSASRGSCARPRTR